MRALRAGRCAPPPRRGVVEHAPDLGRPVGSSAWRRARPARVGRSRSSTCAASRAGGYRSVPASPPAPPRGDGGPGPRPPGRCEVGEEGVRFRLNQVACRGSHARRQRRRPSKGSPRLSTAPGSKASLGGVWIRIGPRLSPRAVVCSRKRGDKSLDRHQLRLVGDGLRQLDGETEALVHRRRPTLEGGGPVRAVKGGVDLGAIEDGRVAVKGTGRRRQCLGHIPRHRPSRRADPDHCAPLPCRAIQRQRRQTRRAPDGRSSLGRGPLHRSETAAKCAAGRRRRSEAQRAGGAARHRRLPGAREVPAPPGWTDRSAADPRDRHTRRVQHDLDGERSATRRRADLARIRPATRRGRAREHRGGGSWER